MQLFELSRTYHSALTKIDSSRYESSAQRSIRGSKVKVDRKSSNPPCEHRRASKILQVKKDGPNKVQVTAHLLNSIEIYTGKNMSETMCI